MAGATGGEDEPLVGTPEAAKQLGISARSLQRYAALGLITPALTLPSPTGARSGQMRWKVSELRRQLQALSQRRGEDAP